MSVGSYSSCILVVSFSASVLFACGSPKDEQLFDDGTSTVKTTCDTSGTWATYVVVGVGWESGTIKAGAGIVKQWILTHRQMVNGVPQDTTQACGIGAKDVPLGSAWFATKEFQFPDHTIPSEWTGVQFYPSLFDNGRLPQFELELQLHSEKPYYGHLGDTFGTVATPFQFGIEGLGPDDPWPVVADMMSLVTDHDGDGNPGLTGAPFHGPVPGEPDGTEFSDPRLGLEAEPARAGALFMAIRTRAALEGMLVSCDPPRLEGNVVEGSLLIETRNVGCVVAGTNAPCTPDQVNFIDSNLPAFKPNGTSKAISIKVADDITCSAVRAMDFGVKEMP